MVGQVSVARTTRSSYLLHNPRGIALPKEKCRQASSDMFG